MNDLMWNFIVDNVTPKNSSSICQVQIANKFPVDKTSKSSYEHVPTFPI